MPLYEYECKACQKVFSAIQKMSDEPLNECECGQKGQVHRIISKNSFQLKGSGWYAVDSKAAPSTTKASSPS